MNDHLPPEDRPPEGHDGEGRYVARYAMHQLPPGFQPDMQVVAMGLAMGGVNRIDEHGTSMAPFLGFLLAEDGYDSGEWPSLQDEEAEPRTLHVIVPSVEALVGLRDMITGWLAEHAPNVQAPPLDDVRDLHGETVDVSFDMSALADVEADPNELDRIAHQLHADADDLDVPDELRGRIHHAIDKARALVEAVQGHIREHHEQQHQGGDDDGIDPRLN